MYILSTWQDDWNGAVANKLHSDMPVLGDWQFCYRRYGTAFLSSQLKETGGNLSVMKS